MKLGKAAVVAGLSLAFLSVPAWWSVVRVGPGPAGPGQALAQTYPGQAPARPYKVEGETTAPDDAAREAQEERQREQRTEALVRRARAGKHSVVSVGQMTVGQRDLVTATLESDAGRIVALVPSFMDRATGLWRPEGEIVKALTALPQGKYEVINTEDKYGIIWVVGVGESSAKSLADLERQQGVRGPSEPRTTRPAASGKEEVKTERATGRFVELGEEKVGATAVKVLVIERGVTMVRAEFLLATPQSRGGVRVDRNVVKAAEGLKAGETVEIEFVEQEGKYYATGLKKEE